MDEGTPVYYGATGGVRPVHPGRAGGRRLGSGRREHALVPPYGLDALAGLDEFSHLDVVYLFHLVDPARPVPHARHPRGNQDWPLVGIFAQRAKDRPNRIGVSTCRLVAVDRDTVHVRGLDAIDGTPVLDLKPHLVEFGPRGPVHQPQWSHELMTHYW